MISDKKHRVLNTMFIPFLLQDSVKLGRWQDIGAETVPRHAQSHSKQAVTASVVTFLGFEATCGKVCAGVLSRAPLALSEVSRHKALTTLRKK